MPAALIPIITAVASAAVGIGSTIYNDVNQPGIPQAPKPGAPAGPTPDQLKAAITPQALSIESATGGSVSPDYLSTIAPILAGVGGGNQGEKNVINQIIQGITGNTTVPSFGGGTGGSAPFSPSGLPTNVSGLAQTPGTSTYLQNLASQI